MHIFAKSLLTLVCVIAAQTMWAFTTGSEMNIYATVLNTTTEISRDNRQVRIQFALASPAKGVWVYIDTDKDGDFTDETAVYENADQILDRDEVSTITVTIPEIYQGGVYNWAVKVAGAPKDTKYDNNSKTSFGFNEGSSPLVARDFENADNRYRFQHPRGLAINTYYESPYCGYSYVGEAGSLSNLVETSKTPRRMGSSQGIYVFEPDMGKIWSSIPDNKILNSAPYGAFTGDVEWWSEYDDINHGPSHLTTDEDGYVYVCQTHRTNKKLGNEATEIKQRVWRAHASNLTTENNTPFDCVLTTDQLYEKNLPKRTFAIAVGEGENSTKVLYVISGTISTSTGELTSRKLSSWTIKENGDGTCSLDFIKSLDLTEIDYATSTQNKLNQSLTSPFCSIAPDKEGGLWIFQKASSSADDEKFAALHLNNQWEADYRIPSNEQCNISGIGAISKHHAFNNSSDYYLAIPTRANKYNTGSYVMKVFRIYKDNDGRIHRDATYVIYDPVSNPVAGFGAEGLDAVAFDAANNLYFTSSVKGLLYVYSLPKENYHITPAPTTKHLNIPYKVTWNRNGITEDNSNATTHNYMYSTDVVPTLSKEGYIFHGWYDANGNKVTQITQNITLNAKWTELVLSEGTTSDNQPVIQAANEIAPSSAVSIKVNRKLQGEIFSTLCLPFDIITTTLTNATPSLANTTLWTLNQVTSNDDGSKTLTFTQVNEVSAYTPFLIKPTNDITETIIFKNVVISNISNHTTAGTKVVDGITFQGIINPTALPANSFFLVADNRLAEMPDNIAEADKVLGGLRGYFINTTGAPLQIRIDKQNTPTLLEDIINTNSTTYKILQNGKIYIAKDGQMYDLLGNKK